MSFSEEPDDNQKFFAFELEIVLTIVALLSSLISLLVPCLYYLKKQCRQHPTVLIANISLLESLSNYNILLIAHGIYKFQRITNIQKIFEALTFYEPEEPTQNTFCIFNFYVYMVFELLSLSFHLCYAVDLFITLKFPFFNSRKRMKFYYFFSVLFPLAAIITSLPEGQDICVKQFHYRSIYKIPLAFLAILGIFLVVSTMIITYSFFTSKNTCKIRNQYIKSHRYILLLLMLMWIAPIWENILILEGDQQSTLFEILNNISFFCLLTESGLINVIRFWFDPFLFLSIKNMILCRSEPLFQIQVNDESFSSITSKNNVKKQNQRKIDSWNLPLSGAISEFHSQQIVHNIIQIILEACEESHQVHGRISLIQSEKTIRGSYYQSVFRNTIVVQKQAEISGENFIFSFMEQPNEQIDKIKVQFSTLKTLKMLSKRKRKYEMVCKTEKNQQSIKSTKKLKERNVKKIRQKKKTLLEEESIAQIEEQKQYDELPIKVVSYAHRMFSSLRKTNHITIEQLEKSLNLEKNIKNIRKAKESLGASGSFFFFSFDNKLVIKTISEEESDALVKLLPYYYDHLRSNFNSLLGKIYGLFSIEIAGVSKIDFILMENSFETMKNQNLQYRVYDLKGSTVSREVKELSSDVLKDINYFNSPDCFIMLSKSRRLALIEQIDADISMLKQQNIMDYSLLLGIANTKAREMSHLKPKNNEYEQVDQYNWLYMDDCESLTSRIYCISIIDFLQEFNFNKKAQWMLKRIFKGGGDISSINTEAYYRRFIKFVSNITVALTNRGFNSSKVK